MSNDIGMEPEFEKKLTDLLEQILEDKVGKIPKAEMDLIVQITKEMIMTDKENFPSGLNKDHLKFHDIRDKLTATLVAATSAALYLERHLTLVEKCQESFDNYLKLSKDPKATPEALKALKDELKHNLNELNKLEPNPENRRKNEALINDEALMEKLINTKEALNAKKERGEPKTNADKEADKKLEDSLHNLFGVDPHVTGKITGPVLAVMGDLMGIPDAYPAYSSNAPIHESSGDLTSTGDDLHGKYPLELFTKQAEDLLESDSLDDHIYNAAHSAPKLTHE